jgi:DNA topoisomerase VI subunit B
MSAPALARHIFKTSRLAEFCSRKELTNQTGHAIEDWPLVVLKELLDNAIDAAEEADVAPCLEIEVSHEGISIADNGPGIGTGTVADILDYTVRVSSREAYVSPTRGAQGNALKTILAMPFVLDGERGDTVIESRGVAHRISFSIDKIRQEPRITRTCETSLVKIGTKITLIWPIGLPPLAIHSGVSVHLEKVSVQSLLGSARDGMSRSSRFCISPAPASITSIAGSPLFSFLAAGQCANPPRRRGD